MRLSELIHVNRRYSRSINLERDMGDPESLEGYIPTERAVLALQRILRDVGTQRKQARAWTLTGVYGTGKSAFAHFLTALLGKHRDPMRQKAMVIASQALGAESESIKTLERVPQQGWIRAVVAAQREPISHTVLRALERGIEEFWPVHQRPEAWRAIVDLKDLEGELDKRASLTNVEVLKLVEAIQKAAGVPVLLVLDELGKALEYTAQHQGEEDVYLLQQLAEQGREVYVLGILHQGFTDYGARLATTQRQEWAKIQGRFEEIPFVESAEQMVQVMGRAIIQAKDFSDWGSTWYEQLKAEIPDVGTGETLGRVYPLHPLAALALPQLCLRYAQNDRSLFTFLTSEEPFSFQEFLRTTLFSSGHWPTLQLHQVYDYFVESVGKGSKSQRWLEVQERVEDARHWDPDWVKVLKTIGVLNLVTTTGSLRAKRSVVALALCDEPNPESQNYWQEIIQHLVDKGQVTHRRLMDELRLWQGSDFDVELQLQEYLQQEQGSLVDLLTTYHPLKPVVVQRHSYETGTLRYFERRYLDGGESLAELACESTDADGLLGYWVTEELPEEVPAQTKDGKPLVMVSVTGLGRIRVTAQEYGALQQVRKAPELQTDGVARLEVRQRLSQAKALLDEAIAMGFDVGKAQCWVQGIPVVFTHERELNAQLSAVCDQVYDQGLVLWNELINRRELTSQGAKARRVLLEGMLEKAEIPRLGLEGHGPEVSMYDSLLAQSGIHRQMDGTWGFYPPTDEGVARVWQAIEGFCLGSQQQRSLGELYAHLEAPPYGVKRGSIPVLLAAVLLHHVDDVSVYKDGTFIPVLGAEHFELLVKDPSRFAVKYFEITGLRSQVFQELEDVLRSKAPTGQGIRNLTLLSVVKPLFQFVKKLPAHTRKTTRLSSESQAVLQTLMQAQEPDELLFTALPKAVGMDPFVSGLEDDGSTARIFRKKLVQALHEIQTCYERLVTDSQELLYSAFGIRSPMDNLRADLKIRANYLVGQVLEPTLRSFVLAAVDEIKPDHEWLESLLMIVADKPAESWSDEDVTRFEVNLSDLARRFKNLEALQSEVRASKKEGFVDQGSCVAARRITITRPDGKETHRMVWMDEGIHATVQPMIDKILRECRDPQIQQALVTGLTETIFAAEEPTDVLGHKKPRQDPSDDRLRFHLK
ncbi:hypothetical protein [Thermostichus vulcanus]|uniref:ATP-binding protein n=1 Tax=Thermostichus vulcanus str. 'Rupite' TaxID=2813851 RepID=A0ABT0CCR7_THEVL|nr:hypothetical protein [Thermostichus vulcanus]MCJ2543575.1 hypothetical protein [Thermostichus vulcanus str. 'Rupite']